MKKFTLLLFSFVYLSLNAQTWINAFTIENLAGARMFHDKSGFIYYLGYDLDTCAGSNYGDTGLTLYKIQKIDPSTRLKVWEKRILSSTFFRVANAIFIGDQIYIGGEFKGNICHDNLCLNSTGGFDICCITVSTNGNIIVKKEGGIGDEEAGGFSVDDNKNIYLTGRATGQIVLGTRSYNTLGKTDFYIMKKDSSYNEIWTKIGKTDSCNYGCYSAWGMSILIQNNYFYSAIGGKSVMEVTFDTLGCGDECDYIFKFDLDGHYLRSFPSIASNPQEWCDLSFSDTLDNLYYFHGYEDHYQGYRYEYLIKVDSADFLIWNQPYGYDNTSLDYSLEYISDIIKRNNNYYLSGTGYNPVSFIPYYYLIQGNLSAGNEEQFIAIPRSQGSWGGYIAEYINNDFLYFGAFKDTIKFGSQTLISPNSLTGFVAILDWNVSASIQNPKVMANEIDIYPNPSSGIFTINLRNNSIGTKVTVRDALGSCVLEKSCQGESSQEINLSCQPRGIYFVELLSGEERVVKKVAIQ